MNIKFKPFFLKGRQEFAEAMIFKEGEQFIMLDKLCRRGGFSFTDDTIQYFMKKLQL